MITLEKISETEVYEHDFDEDDDYEDDMVRILQFIIFDLIIPIVFRNRTFTRCWVTWRNTIMRCKI